MADQGARHEYLFDLFPARASVYGLTTLEDFLVYGPKMSGRRAYGALGGLAGW